MRTRFFVRASLAVAALACGGASATARSNPERVSNDPALRASFIAACEAGAGSSYFPVRRGASWRASNTAGALAVDFHATSVHLTSTEGPGWHLALELARMGRGDDLRAVPGSTPPSVKGNRVEYRRGEQLSEWYVNGPLGLEQGFTVGQRPAGTGSLRLELVVGDGLRARLAADGATVSLDAPSGAQRARYAELFVQDAAGRTLPSRLEAKGARIGIVVDDRDATYPIVIDPLMQQAQLAASDMAEFDTFGSSVSVSGGTAVVGAPGRQASVGAAYVFVRSGSSWTQQQQLLPPGGSADINFGWSVAISGNTIAVGAVTDQQLRPDAGAIFVFVRSGTVWAQQQKLLSPVAATATGDALGASVSIEGNTIVGGAPGDGAKVGSTYVYTRAGSTWSAGVALPTGGSVGGDAFGYAVAIRGTTAVVGAPFASSGRGSAFTYTLSGSTWSLQQKLVPGDPTTSVGFGSAVDVHNNTALIGAPGNFSNIGGGGYVFLRTGTSWAQQAKLIDPTGEVDDAFGIAVAVNGDSAAVSADHKGAGDAFFGSVSMFARSGTSWTLQQELVPADAGFDDQFGISMSTDGVTWLAGAYGHTFPGGPDFGGAAYVYASTTPPPAPALAGFGWSLVLSLMLGATGLVVLRARRGVALRGSDSRSDNPEALELPDPRPTRSRRWLAAPER